jgi:single-stranded-DNA-specific exonuclease
MDGRRLEAMRFNALDPLPARFRAAYRLSVNDYNGMSSVQVNLEHVETA